MSSSAASKIERSAADPQVPSRRGPGLGAALRGLLSGARLDSAAETWVLWSLVAGFGLLFVAWPYLPFTDYPAHLGLAGSLMRVLRGIQPDATLFETNLASYNSLFHLAVALLAMLMPVDTAAAVVMASIVALTCFALISLLRACGRPLHRAFLGCTFAINYPVAWGFSNFCLGAAIGLLVLARVIRRTGAERWTFDAFTVLLAMLGMCTHLMATCAVYALCLTVLLVRMFEAQEHMGLRLLAAVRAGVPLLPPLAYAAWVYARQQSGHVQNSDFAALNGLDNHAWYKLLHFFQTAAGFRSDGFDQYVLRLVFASLLVAWFFRARGRRGTALPLALLLMSCALYIFLPDVVWSTARVYQRMSLLVCIFAVVATPAGNPLVEATERCVFPALAVAALAAFAQLRLAQAPILADLRKVVDEAPPNRRVVALVDEAYLDGWGQNAVGHVGGYYVARRGGECAVSFARYMSLPVHYREETTPAAFAPGDLAWHGTGKYSPDEPYASYFDLVLLRTKSPHDERVQDVFGANASKVKILSSHGEWAVLDAKAVFEDREP